MRKTTRRWIGATAIIIVLAGGGLVAYRTLNPAQTNTFITQPVQRGNIEDSVLANGMLQASKLVSVGAQVSGQITNLSVALGQSIKKGTPIAQIDSLTQENDLKEAQATLRSIDAQIVAKQAQIKQAQLEYNRQKKMLAASASSRADYESAEADLTVYRAELKELKAQKEQDEISVSNAKVDLGYTKIIAPMDGTIVYTAVEVGQTVNSNQTTPTIVEMANLDTMTVQAQISEADVVKVKAGQKVYFTILGKPDHRYYGTLRAIEPGSTSMDGDDSDMSPDDDDAVYYNALFDVANPDHTLRIGMTAAVTIVLNQAQNALLVPAQVLQKVSHPMGQPPEHDNGEHPQPPAGDHGAPPAPPSDGSQPNQPAAPNDSDTPQYRVPVLVDGKVVYRTVTVGINNNVNAEILSGLKAGDQIVTGMASADTSQSSRRHGPPPMGL